MIDNWRWAGVPVFIRTGKELAVTETEMRLIFRRPPKLHFVRELHRHPESNQIVFKIDPTSGIQIRLDAQRANKPRDPRDRVRRGVRRARRDC